MLEFKHHLGIFILLTMFFFYVMLYHKIMNYKTKKEIAILKKHGLDKFKKKETPPIWSPFIMALIFQLIFEAGYFTIYLCFLM